MIINDLRRYWSFAAVLEHLSSDGLMAQREQSLRALTTNVPSYEIGLTFDQPCHETVNAIAALLS